MKKNKLLAIKINKRKLVYQLKIQNNKQNKLNKMIFNNNKNKIKKLNNNSNLNKILNKNYLIILKQKNNTLLNNINFRVNRMNILMFLMLL